MLTHSWLLPVKYGVRGSFCWDSAVMYSKVNWSKVLLFLKWWCGDSYKNRLVFLILWIQHKRDFNLIWTRGFQDRLRLPSQNKVFLMKNERSERQSCSRFGKEYISTKFHKEWSCETNFCHSGFSLRRAFVELFSKHIVEWHRRYLPLEFIGWASLWKWLCRREVIEVRKISLQQVENRKRNHYKSIPHGRGR